MRVLLLNPYFSRKMQFGELGSIMSIGKPLNLGMLGAYLESHGIEVKILDGQIVHLDRKRLALELETFQPSAVGITCMTTSVSSTHYFAGLLKDIDPGLKIIVGGIHPTIYPDAFLKDGNIDLVVRGEGEVAFLNLLSRIDEGRELDDLPGLSLRLRGEYRHNPLNPPIRDLDSLPLFPDHLFEIDKYDARLQLLTSRGCPFNCIFCSVHTVMGRGFRAQSAERVLRDIDRHIETFGMPRYMWFADDTFVVDKERTYRICDLLIEKGYHRIKWVINSRVDLLDEDLFKRLKEAGCVQINMGVESASQRLLDILRKGTTVEQNEKAIEMARAAGLRTRATLMIGIPGETLEESLKTIDYANKINVDTVRFSIATPYPGTELWDIAVKEGMDPDVDWGKMSSVSGYSEYNPVYSPSGREPQELKALQRRGHMQFYLKPRNLLKLKFLHIGEISWRRFFQPRNLIHLPWLIWFLIRKDKGGPPSKGRLRKIVQLLVIAVVVFFLGRNLYSNWSQLISYQWNPNFAFLGSSLLLLITCALLVATGWNMILKIMGQQVPHPNTLRIFFLSELGKYVPGKIWTIMSRMLLAQKEGVPKVVTAASIGTQLIIQVISGLLAVLVTLPFWQEKEVPSRMYYIFFLLPVGLICLHPRVFNPVLSWIIAKFKKVTIKTDLKYSQILLLVLYWAFLWGIKGMAAYMLIQAVYHQHLPPHALINTVGLVSLAWVVGTLSFIAPAGLGITEVVMVYLLGALLSIDVGIATAIALLNRVWGIMAELICIGLTAKLVGGNSGETAGVRRPEPEPADKPS
ncbi:MAG: radical SAM protein [PVC group bacterium]